MENVNKQLLDALKSVTLSEEDIELERSVASEEYDKARNVIAKADVMIVKELKDIEESCDHKKPELFEMIQEYGAAEHSQNDGLAIHLLSKIKDAIAAAEQAQQAEPVAFGDDVVQYISRWGGHCRNCADNMGICHTGLPCGDGDKAIAHVLTALAYGINNGFLPRIPAQPPAVADRDAIRRVFMAHGFTIKEGQTDLKPYVYEAAEALLRELSPAVAVPGFRDLTDDELWEIRNHVAINEVTRDDDSKTICVKHGRAIVRAMLAAAQKGGA